MSQPIIRVSDLICQSVSLARERQSEPGCLARCCGMFGVSELSRKKGEAPAFGTSFLFILSEAQLHLKGQCTAPCTGNEQVGFILCYPGKKSPTHAAISSPVLGDALYFAETSAKASRQSLTAAGAAVAVLSPP